MTDEAASTASASGEIERRVIDLFVDGVRVLGLPKSIGEIYGTLFLSEHPLAFDDLVDRLGISKGSVSQGLRALRQIGAVSECPNGTGRRTYYQPETQLKRLVGGFIPSKWSRISTAARASSPRSKRLSAVSKATNIRNFSTSGSSALSTGSSAVA